HDVPLRRLSLGAVVGDLPVIDAHTRNSSLDERYHRVGERHRGHRATFRNARSTIDASRSSNASNRCGIGRVFADPNSTPGPMPPCGLPDSGPTIIDTFPGLRSVSDVIDLG